MTTWFKRAQAVIQTLDNRLTDTLTKAERVKAVREAYPWAERSGYAYKAWLKAQRQYLGIFNEDGLRCWPKRPTGLEGFPRDPVTGRPMI